MRVKFTIFLNVLFLVLVTCWIVYNGGSIYPEQKWQRIKREAENKRLTRDENAQNEGLPGLSEAKKQLLEDPEKQEQNRNDPFGKSNIVKVLNRVRCNEGSHECFLYASDEMLRNQCFLNGYVTSIMNQQVQSSRDIVELIPINIPHFRGESVYCIGSEYITK